jgi:hypothetical protein
MATIGEDEVAFHVLEVSHCLGAATVGLGAPSTDQFLPSLNNTVLRRAFRTDASGSATVEVTVTCPNGSATRTAAVVVEPRPDLDYQFEELSGSMAAPRPFTFRVNGSLVTIPPESGKLQLERGDNSVMFEASEGYHAELEFEVAGTTYLLGPDSPHAIFTLGSDDVNATVKARRLH